MSACNFSISFSGSADVVVAKAKKAVESQNGQFSGDSNSGNFSVSVFGNTIVGSYITMAQQLQVTIEEKPFLLPCNAIEGFLKTQLGS